MCEMLGTPEGSCEEGDKVSGAKQERHVEPAESEIRSGGDIYEEVREYGQGGRRRDLIGNPRKRILVAKLL